ncbi:MAG: alpha/beta hydrolase-fold protein [Planctomycetota bacterium]|nr:alpha/beta hydrolase-fold protein [Planctomycetota bacterium]
MHQGSLTTLLFVTCLLATPTPGFAKDKQSDLFAELDSVKNEKELRALAQKLTKQYQAKALQERLQRGRLSLTPFSKKEGTVTLIDQLGRSTKLHYVIPDKAAPKNGYGVLLALHGLNAPARQLFNLYRKTANEQGWILLAPHARRLPFGGSTAASGRKVDGNEDTMGIEPLNQWYAYRSYGLPMAALSKIKRHYPINTNQIILSGFSMGGYATWNLGLRYPDRFAALAPLSGSISRQEKFGLADRRSRSIVDNAQRIPMFFVHGAQDSMVPPNSDRFCRDRLKELGANFVYQESPKSSHNLRYWFGDAKKPKSLTTWMTKQKRQPAPRTVEHRSLGKYMNRSYWLEITDSKGRLATIKATANSKNEIRVESKDVKSFRVYIDERIIQLQKPITVYSNGQLVFQGHPKASVLNVLRTWHDREDGHLVYRHSIDCIVGKASAPVKNPRPQSQARKPRAKGKWY